MTDKLESTEADIFTGCGNGTLPAGVYQDPDNYNPSTDFETGVCINDGDLEDIYLHLFHLSTGKPYEGKDPITWDLCGESKPSFPDFPLLNRMDDMYKDFFYNPDEVVRLREECIKVISITPSNVSDLAFRKLIYVCDKAIEVDFHLAFYCD